MIEDFSNLRKAILSVYRPLRKVFGEPWFIMSEIHFDQAYNTGRDVFLIGFGAYPKHITYLKEFTIDFRNTPVGGGMFQEEISPLQLYACSREELSDLIHTKIMRIRDRVLEYIENWYNQQLEYNIFQGIDH